MSADAKTAAELAKLAREINRVHKEITDATQTSIQRSIEVGEMLAEAKRSVAHGKWDEWLATNCRDISDRTARLYMRLAKNEEKLEKAVAENGNSVADLSMRGAAKLLSVPREKVEGGTPKTPKATSKGGVLLPAQPASPDLTTLLKNSAPDELVTALYDAAWDGEQIKELIKKLTAALKPAASDQLRGLPPQPSTATDLPRRPNL